MKTEIYGTLGPACSDPGILSEMLQAGMTGIRLNLSHITLKEADSLIQMVADASARTGICPGILIDMQGPELRIGSLKEERILKSGETCLLGAGGIPIPEILTEYLEPGKRLLLDDGKILLFVQEGGGKLWRAEVLRGGSLKSRKSIAIEGTQIPTPAVTEEDRANLREAARSGVRGVMQPFVRNREDLAELKAAMREAGTEGLRILAKIENTEGVKQLDTFLGEADEIVIARGDLGNSMPLWKLPAVQKEISEICRKNHKPFMVVTQMLASMEHSPVPTRAEVSDIFNAVLDGASSVMVTGETAAGEYPVEAIRCLANTVREAEEYIEKHIR